MSASIMEGSTGVEYRRTTKPSLSTRNFWLRECRGVSVCAYVCVCVCARFAGPNLKVPCNVRDGDGRPADVLGVSNDAAGDLGAHLAEVREDWGRLVAVHVDLREDREQRDEVVPGTHIADCVHELLVRPGGLLQELAAGEGEDLEGLSSILGRQLVQLGKVDLYE